MLRTRLWMGAALIALAVAVLIADDWLGPWYPCLLALALLAGCGAARELIALFGDGVRATTCFVGTVLVLLANWPARLGLPGEPWLWIVATFSVVLMGSFMVEAWYFHTPGGTVARLSTTLFAVAYVSLLASFFLQMRWSYGEHGAFALALAIFVPKAGDIGAYTVGRLIGRHRFAPILSPKKSVEGALGGLVLAMGAAWGINALSGGHGKPPLLGNLAAVGFGLSVGIAGMIGDLMESLIKRDCQRKDASDAVPGFGGVLDVLDSILFSAPLAYVYLSWFRA